MADNDQDNERTFFSFMSVEELGVLLEKLNTCDTSQECLAVANDLGGAIKTLGLNMLESQGIVDALVKSVTNKKSGLEREGGLLGFAGIIEKIGKPCEPYLLPVLPTLMEGYADKGAPVKEAADYAVTQLLSLCDPIGVPVVLPFLYDCLRGKWQAKVAALKHISTFATKSPTEIGRYMPDLIPIISECMHDTKKDVSEAAVDLFFDNQGAGALSSKEGLQKRTKHNDVRHHFIKDCIASGKININPDNVTCTVQKLSSTTFVAEVTGPALAVMVPLLVRALNDRSAAVLRSSVIIADNLFKLVRNPADAGQFMPQLLPGLDRIIETAAFPEIRALATAAKNTLVKSASGSENLIHDTASADEIYEKLQQFLSEMTLFMTSFYDSTFYHIASIVSELIKQEIYGQHLWTGFILPYLDQVLLESDANLFMEKIYKHYYGAFLVD